MNYLSFSLVDLVQLPDFKLASKMDDKETMNRILYNLGMDTSKEMEWHWCLHRCLSTNIPQENYRIEGEERLDKEWLTSGNASLDAVIQSSNDISLKDELRKLNPRDTVDWAEEYALDCEIPNDDGDFMSEWDNLEDVGGRED